MLAQEQFQGKLEGELKIVAQNDLMCSEPELMGNVAVTVIEYRTKKEWCSIFHIHFLPDGTLRSATSLDMEGKTWKAFHSPAE